MHDTITFAHGQASFDITVDPALVPSSTGERQTLTCGVVSGEPPRICPDCNDPMDIHQDHEITLRHVPLQSRGHLLQVRRSRSRCRRCGRTETQQIPFKDPDHRITRHLRYLVEKRLAQGHTLKSVSLEFCIHPSIVKDIDRSRLGRWFENRRSSSYSKHLAIDEFLLHRRHRYATVVIDLDSGDILWCQEGKKKEQVYNFMEYMGKDWMEHVEAVAMDMNAQYDSAFAERGPWIAVVYDVFHLVKLYNDTVLTAMRRRKQRELEESGDRQGYQLYKGSRYIVISDRKTLRKKDQLKAAFLETDTKVLFDGLRQWIRMAEEIQRYAKTIKRRIRGLVNHAKYPISSGKLEGTNNLIKTVRRASYGFRDTQYFFWKIMEASRRPYLRYKSHRILS